MGSPKNGALYKMGYIYVLGEYRWGRCPRMLRNLNVKEDGNHKYTGWVNPKKDVVTKERIRFFMLSNYLYGMYKLFNSIIYTVSNWNIPYIPLKRKVHC